MLVPEPAYYVHLVPGALRREWCDRCHTSARVAVDMYVFTAHTTEPGPPAATFAGCLTCDPHLFDHIDD